MSKLTVSALPPFSVMKTRGVQGKTLLDLGRPAIMTADSRLFLHTNPTRRRTWQKLVRSL
jgi:hypothetical protein